ncbi:MAG: hypothetical protein PHF79_01625 [Candidatus Pacebacteria bacterium]|nr:hypothetical protein [Candidatus Paceibacterota bacterium]
MQTGQKILLIIIVLFLLGGSLVLLGFKLPNQSGLAPVYCTQEAKLCPDGSYVGRTGPNCEFTMCPNAGTSTEQSLKTFTDNSLGISFQYPENPVVKYMDAIDWPPKVQILNQPFTCTEAGSETARAGQTLMSTVNGRTYCVTRESEGAAGSIYIQYAYAFPKNDKTVIFTFTVRYVQCGNYSEPQKTECDNLRQAFNLDNVIDQIAQTFKFIPINQKQNSGITGTVLLGPTCPVMRNPPDPQCADKLYATTLVVTAADGSQVIKQFSSKTDGTFSVSLSAGAYVIQSASTGLPRCASSGTIRVVDNQYSSTTIYCDTGIR